MNNTPSSFTDPSGFFQDISGGVGTTNENGYGGSVSASNNARAYARLAFGPLGSGRVGSGGGNLQVTLPGGGYSGFMPAEPNGDGQGDDSFRDRLIDDVFDYFLGQIGQGVWNRVNEEIILARTSFDSIEDAAVEKLGQIFPHSDREGIEYGFIIYEFDEKIYVTPSVTLGLPGKVNSFEAKIFLPEGARVVGIGHTHPGGEAPFSIDDRNAGRPDAVRRHMGRPGNPNRTIIGVDVFMTNRSGRLYQINPFGRDVETNRRAF